MNDLVTSADGQWIVVRRDLTLTLHERGGGPAIATTMLDDASDVEIVAVGPPALFVVRSGTALAVFQPPTLECIAIAKLEAPMSMATVTGQRIALLSADGKQLRLVRAAGRALAMHALDVGSPIEFAVGLDRNQVLFGLHRKLEVWDAASGRPLLRLQLQLPPAPRMIGAAHGHLWATKVGGDEVFIYRLSDGRPFRHPVGAPIERVIGHLGSQVIVVVTKNGLVRVHCLAHSVEMLELPDPTMRDHALGLLATTPDDVALVGCGDGVDAVPWRAPLSGLATTPEPEPVARPAPIPTHTPLAALAQGGPATPPATSSSLASGASATETEARIAIAAYGAALIAAARRELEPREAKEPRESRGLGLDGERRQPAHESRVIEPPSVDVESTIGSLVARLGLGPAARRALFALYGYHLNGERAAIAPLARGLGDWTEILGSGELGALAMVKKHPDGRLGLRRGVIELLDGCAPQAIRLVGSGTPAPRAGLFRVARDGRTDVELEAALGEQLGRIGIVTGDVDAALLEARLHGVAAVVTAPITLAPRRTPKDASLVIVLYGSPTSWVADLPTLA